MIIDLHVHTREYSGCSNLEPHELISRALKLGLGGLALTEHGIRWPDKKLRRLFQDAGRPDFLLLAGQEIRCTSKRGEQEGEYLVFGVGESLGANIGAAELIELVHRRGGVVIAAHPFKPTRHGGVGFYGAGKRVYELNLDAIEVLHPDHTGEYLKMAETAVDRLKLPGTGGSDAHALHDLGQFVTEFLSPIASEDDLIREIKAGRVRPRPGPGKTT